MERADVCRIFYIVSDIINAAISVFAVITLVALSNPDFDAQLGGFVNYAIYSPGGSQSDFDGMVAMIKFFIILALIDYAVVTLFGFFARRTLKNRTNHVWPHILYLITSYGFLGINIVTVVSTFHYWFAFVVAANFVVALVTAIFGMKVHNDV